MNKSLCSLVGVMALSVTALGLAEEITVDFEAAVIGKPLPTWTEKGVIFTLARAPALSKAPGRVMFFPHLATNHKGVLCAMATEPIPVQAEFPQSASSVTLVLWGSTGCAALVEALDKSGNVVNRASVPAVPGRAAPEEAIPFFELKVQAPEIAAIRFSGPRAGEFLAVDEIRFTPLATVPAK